MQLVASLAHPASVPEAVKAGADCIELRLDLFPSPFPEEGGEAVRQCRLPFILTVRSSDEGGAFTGGIREWQALMEPWLPYAAMVDVEQQFSPSAPALRDRGICIIASFHTHRMPSATELTAIESRLRSYGIPKIVVRPGSPDDVITLCSFTLHARQPDAQTQLARPLLDTRYQPQSPKMMLTAEQMNSLPDIFKDISDPRRAQGRIHPLPTVLAIATAAVLCGMRGYKTMSGWAQDLGPKARERFGCRRQKGGDYRVPSESIIRDILIRVDPVELDAALQKWDAVFGGEDQSLAIPLCQDICRL